MLLYYGDCGHEGIRGMLRVGRLTLCSTVVVPAGTQHQFINTGPTPLILYTIYSPAEHAPNSVHHSKEEGDKEEEDGVDVAPDWARRSQKENAEKGLVREDGKYD